MCKSWSASNFIRQMKSTRQSPLITWSRSCTEYFRRLIFSTDIKNMNGYTGATLCLMNFMQSLYFAIFSMIRSCGWVLAYFFLLLDWWDFIRGILFLKSLTRSNVLLPGSWQVANSTDAKLTTAKLMPQVYAPKLMTGLRHSLKWILVGQRQSSVIWAADKTTPFTIGFNNAQWTCRFAS